MRLKVNCDIKSQNHETKSKNDEIKKIIIRLNVNYQTKSQNYEIHIHNNELLH